MGHARPRKRTATLPAFPATGQPTVPTPAPPGVPQRHNRQPDRVRIYDYLKGRAGRPVHYETIAHDLAMEPALVGQTIANMVKRYHLAFPGLERVSPRGHVRYAGTPAGAEAADPLPLPQADRAVPVHVPGADIPLPAVPPLPEPDVLLVQVLRRPTGIGLPLLVEDEDGRIWSMKEVTL